MKHYCIIFLVLICSTFISCECNKPAEQITFSGIVTSGESLVSEAKVRINETESKTEKDGSFSITVPVGKDAYLVNVEKFGYGLYSRSFPQAFSKKTIQLTKGTILEFDPSVDNVLTDSNSDSSIMQSELTDLDTSLLFGIVPKVYDHTGKLVDLGYPPGLENIFDYVKEPITRRPGMSLNLRANSLRSASGNTPPAGTKLRASLSTVDFFNPDGMPGDFTVRYQGDPARFAPKEASGNIQGQTLQKSQDLEDNNPREEDPKDQDRTTEDRFAFMESFGAATIEITDGDESYNLREGETALVTIPVYEIRKKLGETLPPSIPLLHYNETDGVWEVTGTGYLNDTRDAYSGEVSHFSTINFDLIKTGDSKCFKIRQMLINGANSNVGGALGTYRAHVIIPQSSTSTFAERNRVLDESMGCVSISGTALHGVTRIPNDIPNVVVVFSLDGVGNTDTLDIVVVNPAPTSILAETAVTAANDCTTNTCSPTDSTNCVSTGDAVDINNAGTSTCNTCWLSDCALIPFDNSGSDRNAIVGVPMGGGQVKVKWVHNNSTIQGLRVTVHDGSCGGTLLDTIQNLCGSGCLGNTCNGGEITYPGTVSSTVYFKLSVYSDIDCTGLPINETCSTAVTIL